MSAHYGIMRDIHIENNEDVINDYVTSLELLDLKDTSILTRVYCLVPFFEYLKYKKAGDVTKADIGKYIISMKRSKKKKVTQNRDIINLRAFFKWLKPDNDFFNGINIKKEKPDNSKKEYVTAADVVAMLPHCTNQRDRVLLLLMWESGCRLGELLSINLGDVKPHKYGLTLTVEGKTGCRDILIIDSIPDVQQWLNMHKAEKDAPLFPVLSRRGKGERLGSRGAEYVIKALSEKAGLKSRIWCHGLRHGKLSELSNSGMSEMQLRHFAGWSNDSEMPSVYLHVTQDDVFNRLAEIKGIEIEKDSRELLKIMSKKKCPRCGVENAFDSKYCHLCSLILDQKEALEIEIENKTRNEEIQYLKDEINKLKQSMESKKELERKFEQIISYDMGYVNRHKGWKVNQREHDNRMKNDPEYAEKFKEYEKVFYAEYFGAPYEKELSEYKEKEQENREKLNITKEKHYTTMNKFFETDSR